MKRLLSITLLSLLALKVHADDKQVIEKMLNDFLTYNHQLEQHQKFWAEDLVYTSSSGQRFGKSLIINGMQEQLADKTNAKSEEAQASYSATEIDIRLYGDTAILAFKLVAQYKAKEIPSKQFLNTGTLVKRNNNWEVVAWQATKI